MREPGAEAHRPSSRHTADHRLTLLCCEGFFVFDDHGSGENHQPESITEGETMGSNAYAHPEALVSTDWVAQHLDDKNIRLIEVDVDTTQYEQGHVRGAIGWNWHTQLQDQLRRDIVAKEQMEQYLLQAGIIGSTTIVLYGDNNNWFAAYAL
jgi:hypothetical protein